ncbi:putative zinc-binding oxidoreductase ToxD [Daldinia bambusicola]|nr:putative zinc-binding oxidoreductase ToxD [Daldinia bambusicola]
MAATQKALIIQEGNVAKVVTDAPIPKVRPGYVKVKTVAVALNPTDWKHIDGVGVPGGLVGCDYAGIVEELGPDVTNFKVGDKISGFVSGANVSNSEDGAFAEHIVAKAALAIKVPDNLTMEQASTLGVGISTVGQALYQSLGLPLPTEPAKKPFPVLIYGASTATGTLAVQFAKLSGLQVVTTSSPRNFELLKSLGADATFDYNSPTAGEDIRAYTNDGLEYVFDCIAEGSSPEIAAKAISSKGGKYTGLLVLETFPREDVEKKHTLAYTMTGEAFTKLGHEFPANPADLEFGVKFWKLAEQLLAQGKVKPHPADVREGGLDRILEGLDDLRQGRVSGKKIVYKI